MTMKICEVMSRIDEVKANVMSDPEKIKYLDTLGPHGHAGDNRKT